MAELEKIGATPEETKIFHTRGFALVKLSEELQQYNLKIQELSNNELASARQRLYQRRRQDTLRSAKEVQASMIQIIDQVEDRRNNAPFPPLDIIEDAQAQDTEPKQNQDNIQQIGDDMDAITTSFSKFAERFKEKIAKQNQKDKKKGKQ